MYCIRYLEAEVLPEPLSPIYISHVCTNDWAFKYLQSHDIVMCSRNILREKTFVIGEKENFLKMLDILSSNFEE